MPIPDTSNPLEPAANAITRVQREILLRLGTELLSSQRAALAAVQAEMDETTRELSERMIAWRRRTLGLISLGTGLLVTWLVVLGVLGGTTLVLAARARQAWDDVYAAEAAARRIHVAGAMTVVKDGALYVRVDPNSLAQGRRGNWYARALNVDLRAGGDPTP
jgi:hypothetical protein